MDKESLAYIVDLTWTEVKEILPERNTIIIPVAATEQHGPHMCLDTDAVETLPALEEAVKQVGNALIAPTLPFGISEMHMVKPGTVTLREETLAQLLEDVVRSYLRHGFKKVLIWNMHMGNRPPLERILDLLRKEFGNKVIIDIVAWMIFPGVNKTVLNDFDAPTLDGEWGSSRWDRHAGEVETSLMLHIKPEHVRMDKAAGGEPPKEVPKGTPILELPDGQRLVPITEGNFAASGTGIIGNATLATKEKGEKLNRVIVSETVKVLEKFKNGDPDHWESIWPIAKMVGTT